MGRGSRQEVNSPVNLAQLRPCPLSGKLSALEEAAANYIRSFAWSGELLAMYEGFQEPEILGVFLVHLRPAQPHVDEWLWVVVGDLPPAYLVADDNPTTERAVEGYVKEMQRWVDAAKAGASVDKLIPVNVPPTEEFATMLSSRLRILSGTVLDEIRASTSGHARRPGHRSGKASLVQTHRWRGQGRGSASS